MNQIIKQTKNATNFKHFDYIKHKLLISEGWHIQYSYLKIKTHKTANG